MYSFNVKRIKTMSDKNEYNEKYVKENEEQSKEQENEDINDLYWNEIVRNDCQINDISHSF